MRTFPASPHPDTPYVLAQSAVPVCLAPNGTVATNGIVTLGTALPTTYSGGIWLRFPANAIVGGAAGLYWAVMSSTTQGQVYTNFADPASEFIPFIPSGTLVAAVGSNAAYTQTTGADITLANTTLVAGVLGVSGALRCTRAISTTTPSNANAKTSDLMLGAVDIHPADPTTNVYAEYISVTRNRGVANKQFNTRYNTNMGVATTGNTNQWTTVDTSVNNALSITGRIAVATDYVLLEGYTFEILPS